MITLIKKQFKAFMKIRNLLIKVKQKQIERKYPYIFVFHCSGLTNLQWRHLKFLLHKAQGNTFFQPRGGNNGVTNVTRLTSQQFGGGVLNQKLLGVDGGAYFNRKKRACVFIPKNTSPLGHPSSQHKNDKQKSLDISFKTTQELNTSSRVALIKQESAGFGPLSALAAQSVQTEQTHQPENNSGVTNDTRLTAQHQIIAGPLCLLYSTHTTLEKVPSNPWLDLLTNMNSLEYNANLVLLSAHINSNKLNHIDVKELMNLDTQSVLGLFLQSINLTAQYFDFCLNSNTAEILQYEALRKNCLQETESNGP